MVDTGWKPRTVVRRARDREGRLRKGQREKGAKVEKDRERGGNKGREKDRK